MLSNVDLSIISLDFHQLFRIIPYVSHGILSPALQCQGPWQSLLILAQSFFKYNFEGFFCKKAKNSSIIIKIFWNKSKNIGN